MVLWVSPNHLPTSKLRRHRRLAASSVGASFTRPKATDDTTTLASSSRNFSCSSRTISMPESLAHSASMSRQPYVGARNLISCSVAIPIGIFQSKQLGTKRSHMTHASVVYIMFRRFCSTFLRRPEETAASPDSWSPLFSRLQSSLPQIQGWASLTEQLLGLLELSSMILGRSWPFPPGGELSARWQNLWADGTITSSTYTWDWSEFKATMALRARLWEQSFPEQLDPSINHTMAVQLGCRAIGLDLVSGKYITIA